ncbi:DUF6876 family protein [Sphingobacterium faecium]|uniref:DUF6876 family protein n=1 Tax=Sphingobacterium faecium TaxID=34087 RepID=UPI0024693157|nr:DUF6876 family protein [Sphingobacterium faecium]MDH5828830.1 hypothetical protein [Sphingobacterium faecium]WGQ17027.1 hypothetical protein QG727_22900 [Sphingobacterium faecium]
MENSNKKTTAENQKLNSQINASATKNNFGLPIEYQNEDVKDFFSKLVSVEDWQDDFKFANEPFMGSNGAECVYKHPFGYKFTNGVKDLAEQNQSYWLIDFIISTAKFSILPHDFQVWYLLIKEGKNYIVCDDGNYNVLVAYELPLTDFDTYGCTAVYFYLIDDLLLLPQEY